MEHHVLSFSFFLYLFSLICYLLFTIQFRPDHSQVSQLDYQQTFQEHFLEFDGVIISFLKMWSIFVYSLIVPFVAFFALETLFINFFSLRCNDNSFWWNEYFLTKFILFVWNEIWNGFKCFIIITCLYLCFFDWQNKRPRHFKNVLLINTY